jgi:hypothetical protein
MRPDGRPAPRPASVAWPLLAAAVLTLLNCVKPLHIDDSAYYYYAAHIANHPLDPYGFEVFWYERPQPAHEVLAPPVVPYWWAAAIRLFGDRPVLWKLWLFPFSLLLSAALYHLFWRFAPGWEVPLLWAAVLSPTVLPGYNLMLDVPALALGLAALAVFMRACDRDAPRSAAVAGVLAGLALEAKYTALVVPPTLLLYGWLYRKPRLPGLECPALGCCLDTRPERQRRDGPRAGAWGLCPAETPTSPERQRRDAGALSRRWRSGLVSPPRSVFLQTVLACAVALAVFGAWEAAMARLYGQSHFLYHLLGPGAVTRDNPSPILSLVMLLGGTGPALALLSLTALGIRGRVMLATGVALLLGYAALVGLGDDAGRSLRLAFFSFVGAPGCRIRFTAETLLFGIPGLLLCGTLAAVVRRSGQDRANCFLAGWLVLELCGHFALTPFPAARRVMGVSVVATLLIGRLASRTCRTRRRALWARVVLLGGIGLGLSFCAVDWCDARAQEQAAARAAHLLQRQKGVVWYVGHWGFQYYAERAGMKPVIPGKSRLRRGDWLIAPDSGIAQQHITLPRDRAEAVDVISGAGGIPLRTVAGYYGSRTPLEPLQGPRVTVTVYRIRADFIPAAANPAGRGFTGVSSHPDTSPAPPPSSSCSRGYSSASRRRP